MTPAPYWKLPGAYTVVPRQRKFKANMELLDGELANAINSCLADRVEEVSAWQDKGVCFLPMDEQAKGDSRSSNRSSVDCSISWRQLPRPFTQQCNQCFGSLV